MSLRGLKDIVKFEQKQVDDKQQRDAAREFKKAPTRPLDRSGTQHRLGPTLPMGPCWWPRYCSWIPRALVSNYNTCANQCTTSVSSVLRHLGWMQGASGVWGAVTLPIARACTALLYPTWQP